VLKPAEHAGASADPHCTVYYKHSLNRLFLGETIQTKGYYHSINNSVLSKKLMRATTNLTEEQDE